MTNSPQTLWTLLVLASLAMGALALWTHRRLGGATRSGTGAMKVLETLSLGPRERLLLVQVGDKHLVLGMTPTTISTLHHCDDLALLNDEHSPPVSKQTRGFADLLRAAGGNHGKSR